MMTNAKRQADRSTDNSRTPSVIAARTNPAYAAQLKLWAAGRAPHPGTNYAMTEAKDFAASEVTK